MLISLIFEFILISKLIKLKKKELKELNIFNA